VKWVVPHRALPKLALSDLGYIDTTGSFRWRPRVLNVMEDLAYIKSISPDELTDQEFYEWLDSTEARNNRYLEIVFNDSDES